MNVAHSLIEEQEKAYLNDELDQAVRKPSHDTIAAVVTLSAEARENMKLAMEIKRERSKAMVDLIKVMKKN